MQCSVCVRVRVCLMNPSRIESIVLTFPGLSQEIVSLVRDPGFGLDDPPFLTFTEVGQHDRVIEQSEFHLVTVIEPRDVLK